MALRRGDSPLSFFHHSCITLSLAIVVSCLLGQCHFASSTNIDPKKVEIKTEAPPDDTQAESPKACYEYLHGRLHTRRRHGETWQNGMENCMNCTCLDGETGCIFHFCKGPPTGYMTPPSINNSDIDLPPVPPTASYPEDIEESSGYPPNDLNSIGYDDDEDIDDEVNQYFDGENDLLWPIKKVSIKETGLENEEFTNNEMERQENETHELMKSYFCGKTCMKICKYGFKVNPLTGCLKCRCNKCSTPTTCQNVCNAGYLYDSSGCRTCKCRLEVEEEPYLTTDADLIFVSTEDEQDLLTSTPGEDYSSMSNHIPNIEKDWLFMSKAESSSSSSTTERAPQSMAGYPWKDIVSSKFEGSTDLEHSSSLEVHPQTWMHPSSQPEMSHQIKQTSNIKGVNRDEATVKSVAKSNNSELLLLILVPFGVLVSLATLVSIGFWRRYHRDKYDITTFRPSPTEEREQLRPVTVMADENLSTPSLGRQHHV